MNAWRRLALVDVYGAVKTSVTRQALAGIIVHGIDACT